jgi:hypothetical protein
MKNSNTGSLSSFANRTRQFIRGAFFLVTLSLSLSMIHPASADWAQDHQDYNDVAHDRALGFKDWSIVNASRVENLIRSQQYSINNRLLLELSRAKQSIRGANFCKQSLFEIYGQLDFSPEGAASGTTYGLMAIYGALISAMADSGATVDNFSGLIQDSEVALIELYLALEVAIDTCGPVALTDVCSRLSGVWTIMSTQFMGELSQWIVNNMKKEKYNGTASPATATYYQYLASPLAKYLNTVVDPLFFLKEKACSAAVAKASQKSSK